MGNIFLNEEISYVDKLLDGNWHDILKEDYELILESMHKNPYVDEVTIHIDNILKHLKKDDSSIVKYQRMNPNDKYIIREMKEMERCFNKAFNINVHFLFDTEDYNKVRYGACIFITDTDAKEVEKKIETIIETKEEGYHFIKIKECKVQVQEAIFYFIKNNNLNARHLTAILLHEIGHKVFLQLNTKIEGNYYKVRIGSYVLCTLEITAGIIALPKLITLLVAVPLLGYLNLGALGNVLSSKEYSKTESNCDNMAIMYGYGKEIYEVFVKFELIGSKYLATKRNFIRNLTNTDYQRRQLMIKNIINEINNPENTESERKELKKILDYINKITYENTKKGQKEKKKG